MFICSNITFSQNLVPGFHSNPISAWHGSQQKSLDSICWYGLLSLSKNDPGIYSPPFTCYNIINYNKQHLYLIILSFCFYFVLFLFGLFCSQC